MNKEIEKYVGLYLLVYILVLVVSGFFQYMAVCQGQSLACTFDMEGMNTIITTTAYVLTPIVAIIGFLSWKEQYNIQLEKDNLKELKEKIIHVKYILNYFDVHLRDLYDSVKDSDIDDFKKIIIDYDNDKEELSRKRRQFSHIIIEYYSSLEDSIYEIEDKKLDDIYKRMNIYSYHLDGLIQAFNENKIKSFIHFFEIFNFKSTKLIEDMKIQINDINIELKV